jgi:hypothetical protein
MIQARIRPNPEKTKRKKLNFRLASSKSATHLTSFSLKLSSQSNTKKLKRKLSC